jgi:hypothetical protein
VVINYKVLPVNEKNQVVETKIALNEEHLSGEKYRAVSLKII